MIQKIKMTWESEKNIINLKILHHNGKKTNSSVVIQQSLGFGAD
ncbi:MAG: hypothetical protein U9N33_08650 [Campylobacterota bacterium]|nr:hypothetical protein [Campylobacterota bacterium]